MPLEVWRPEEETRPDEARVPLEDWWPLEAPAPRLDDSPFVAVKLAALDAPSLDPLADGDAEVEPEFESPDEP